jgi:hypothetical protein
MMAQRQAEGCQPGAKVEGGAAPAGARPQGQGGATTFQRPGGGSGGGDGAGGRVRQQAPRVWLMDESGKLKMAFLRTGVSDTTYSEIVRGELKEGDVVIAGTLTASSTSPRAGMGQMMFAGGRRR